MIKLLVCPECEWDFKSEEAFELHVIRHIIQDNFIKLINVLSAINDNQVTAYQMKE
mgnify:CR=1 FL=1